MPYGTFPEPTVENYALYRAVHLLVFAAAVDCLFSVSNLLLRHFLLWTFSGTLTMAFVAFEYVS